MNVKIVLTKNLNLYQDQIERIKSIGEVKFYHDESASPDEWLERCKGADIICSGVFGLRSDKVYELRDVFLSLPFVGVDFLDKKKLAERNIIVSNTPGCNKEAVTEWIIGMILMRFRRLNELTNTTNQNRKEVIQTGASLYNKKITILGVGNIGRYLGSICECLGMKVTFFRREDDLLASVENADIIVNCLGVNETTNKLLDKTFFSSLKKGSFFASIARHQTYDVQALINALDKEILIGAVDDMAHIDIGDVNNDDYKALLTHPKMFITPHIAWSADSEIRKSNDIMIDNIEAWINKKPINLI